MSNRLALIAVLLCATLTPAQQTPNPCAAPEQKQFDFWVGSWDATWPGAKSGEVGRGSNSITRILDGCVVEENFSGGDSALLRGRSVSIFVTQAGKWKQTWVDNQGAYLDFTGEWKNGQMVLSREAIGPGGVKSLQRMVYKNISANEFDWSWESSTDGGKTWTVQWPIHYKRRS